MGHGGGIFWGQAVAECFVIVIVMQISVCICHSPQPAGLTSIDCGWATGSIGGGPCVQQAGGRVSGLPSPLSGVPTTALLIF